METMELRFRLTRKRIGVFAALAALITASGVAYAAIPDGNGLYWACKLNSTGTIRLIDKSLPSTSWHSKCSSLETEVSWNHTGPRGPQGIQGEKGERGPQGEPGPPGDSGLVTAERTTAVFAVDQPVLEIPGIGTLTGTCGGGGSRFSFGFTPAEGTHIVSGSLLPAGEAMFANASSGTFAKVFFYMKHEQTSTGSFSGCRFIAAALVI